MVEGSLAYSARRKAQQAPEERPPVTQTSPRPARPVWTSDYSHMYHGTIRAPPERLSELKDLTRSCEASVPLHPRHHGWRGFAHVFD